MKKLLDEPIGYIFVLFVGIVGGIFTATKLSVSMYPTIQKPVIEIWIAINGSNTLETYENHIQAIKRAIDSVEDAEKSDISFYGGGIQIFLEFDYKKDREETKRDVSVAFESLRGELPEENRNFWVGYKDENQGEFTGMFLSTEGRKSEEIYSYVKPLVNSRLGLVKNVDQNASGLNRVSQKQLTIEFDEKNLFKEGLLLPTVLGKIREQFSNFPSGKISAERRTVFIRTVVNENEIEDFKNIVLKSQKVKSGEVSAVKMTRLRDVAAVKIEKRGGQRIFRADGFSANSLRILAVPGGNLWEISNGVKKILNEILPTLPKDIKFKSYLDPSVWVDEAIRNMLISAFIGIFVAVFVILLFLGNLRSTLLIGISIPSSLILSLIAMKASDININMISLGGMALAVGMIVDSSIVVLENIFRVFEDRKPVTSKEKIDCISSAVAEVKWPVIISTLTSIIVFLPLSFTSAMANAILGDMSKVVVFALIISVLAALVYLPIFSKIFDLNSTQSRSISKKWNSLVHKICHGFYLRLLNTLMRKRRRAFFFSLMSFAMLMALVFWVIREVPREIVAEPDARIFNLRFTAKYVTGSEEVMKLIEPYEKKLSGEAFSKEVGGFFVRSQGDKRANLKIILSEGIEPDQFQGRLEREFASTPELRIQIEKWNPTSLPLPKVWDAYVVVDPNTPEDFEHAYELCSALDEKMSAEGSPFLYGWCEPWNSVREELQIHPDRTKLQRMASESGIHLSVRNIADYAKVASHEKYIGEVFFKGEPTRIYAKYREAHIQGPEDLLNLSIPLKVRSLRQEENGQEKEIRSFPLRTFASVKSERVPPMVKVVNGTRNVVMYGVLKNENKRKKKEATQYVASAIEKVRAEKAGLKATMIQKDPYKDVDKSIYSLGFSLIFSLILILSVLVLQFRSIKQSLTIMLAIPLGIFGVVISLYVFKSTLSLNSMLGIILLSGVAVNNSILIVDFFNGIRSKGVSVKESILRAVEIRFRPILMTMMTTIFAMLPIAMSFGSGGKTLQPLGVAVSGGLLVSTIFTLLIVPLTLYLLNFEREKA